MKYTQTHGGKPAVFAFENVLEKAVLRKLLGSHLGNISGAPENWHQDRVACPAPRLERDPCSHVRHQPLLIRQKQIFLPPTAISQLAGRWRRNLNKAKHTQTRAK